MPGQYSNFQGIRMVTLDATKSNLNILMEVGVLYRLTNVQNLAGRQGPLFWFPPYLPGLSLLSLMPSATGIGAVGLSFLQAQNSGDATGIAAPVVAPNPMTGQGTTQALSCAGFTACFFTVQNAGSLSFPTTVQLILTQSEGSTAAAGTGGLAPARRSFLVTNTPLGSNTTFTGPWIDTSLTGDAFVEVIALTNQTAANPPGFRIEGTDDTSSTIIERLAFFQQGNGTGVNANNTASISANIPTRFWRIVFQNAALAQGSLEITATTSPYPQSGLFPTYSVGNQGFMNFGDQRTPVLANFNNNSQPLYGLTVGLAALPAGVALGDAQANGLTVAGLNGATATTPQTMTFPTFNMFYNGSTWDRVRTPNIFKTVQASAAGNTALWTPTAGKKFRLMRFIVDFSANAASAGGVIVTASFQDSATPTNIAFDCFCPNAAGSATGGYTTAWVDLGNGFLSAAANNVLNINLSAALSSGACRVTACGTEE